MKNFNKLGCIHAGILRDARAMGLHAELCGDAVEVQVAAGPGWIQPATLRVSSTVGGCLSGSFTFSMPLTAEEREAFAQSLTILERVSMQENYVFFSAENVTAETAWSYLFANFSFVSLLFSLVLSKREGGHD